MTVRDDRAGFTLTELMIGLVVLGVMGMGLVGLFRVQHQTYNEQNQGVLATQNARAGLDMMAREMRNAGFDPYGDSPAGVTVWTSDSFGFTADLNGSGDVTGEDESVLYYYDEVDDLLVRVEGGAESPLANRITALTFTYYADEGGTVATSADEIEQVQVEIEYATADGALAGSLTTMVALRNQIY